MITLDSFLPAIETGSGFWKPLVWILAVIIAFLLLYYLRSLGSKAYKKKTEQTKVFLSGNPEYDKEYMHVKSSNLYWGFTESLRFFYNVLRKMHSGNTSDYVLWFIIILAIVFIIEVI